MPVDLTRQQVQDEALLEDAARKYSGGRGLGRKILFEELKPDVNPFGPENRIVIATHIVSTRMLLFHLRTSRSRQEYYYQLG